MKAILLLVLMITLIQSGFAQTSPDYIFGDNYGSGWNWTTGTLGTAGRGSSYKWSFLASTSNNLYFKLGETSSNSNGQGFWMNNASPDLQYTGSGAVWNSYYYSNMGANGAVYFTITNGKYYVIKSRKDPANSNTNFSVQQLSASPVTITAVTDNFTAAGTGMTVYITLSGTKSSEEKIFVRYTTDNWTSSSISAEATGSGTSYTATIPAAGITATTNNKYYVFSTTVSSPTTSDADLVAVNYNDNSGNFYNVFSKTLTLQINSWQSRGMGALMWTYMKSVPTTKTCIPAGCLDPTWSSVWAYTRMEYNQIGGTNGLSCGCPDYTGNGAVTTSSASAEETNLLNGTAGVTVYFGGGNLSGFTSNCPVGDRRIYVGNECRIKLNGTDKLVFDSYRIEITVLYSGSINSIGWAKIDEVNSDPTWVKEFDPYGTGIVDFVASSMSPVVQWCFGSYNVVLQMTTSELSSVQSAGTVASQGASINETVSLPNSDVSYNFTQATFGGESGEGNGVYANQIFEAPGGALPSGIDAISQIYWDLSTALSAYTCSLTFDLSSVEGINNTSNLRILKRANNISPWSVWADYTLVDGTHLRANNVISLSEWTIGSSGDNPLPVEISSISHTVTGRNVLLKWETQTEVNSYQFEVERSICGETEHREWRKAGEVFAAGNSNSPKNYSFTDNGLNSGKYEYRLKSVDTDGSYSYSNSVFAEILAPVQFSMGQNYPNPFNPSTVIEFCVPENSWVRLDLFNISGERIGALVDGMLEPGYHSVPFSGEELSSGIYFYRMIAINQSGNNYVNTKKMILKK